MLVCVKPNENRFHWSLDPCKKEEYIYIFYFLILVIVIEVQKTLAKSNVNGDYVLIQQLKRIVSPFILKLFSKYPTGFKKNLVNDGWRK